CLGLLLLRCFCITFLLLICLFFFCCFFFFFQAEDGIRDYKVTGVQTCALPISPASRCRAPRRDDGGGRLATRSGPRPERPPPPRSEERRVGKECRSRWSPDH